MPRARGHAEGARGGLAAVLRPHFGRLAVVLAMLGGLAALNLAPPLVVKRMLDAAGDGGAAIARDALFVVLVTLAVVHALRNGAYYLGRRVTVGVAERVSASLRAEGVRALLGSGARNRPGPGAQACARLIEDTNHVGQFVHERLPTLCLASFTLPAALGALFWLDWGLAMVCAASLPLQWGAFCMLRRGLRTSHGAAVEEQAAFSSLFLDRVEAIEEIAVSGDIEHEAGILEEALMRAAAESARAQHAVTRQKVAGDLLVSGCTIALIAAAGARMGRHGADPAAFYVFIGYAAMLFPTSLDLFSGLGHWTRASASVERARRQRAPTEEPRVSVAAAGPRMGGAMAVECRDIEFGYDGAEAVLDGYSLVVAPGEHVAILGASGAGKTTLVRLVSGLYVPRRGEISVFGRATALLAPHERANLLGVVHAAPHLFDESIRDNILRGLDGKRDEYVAWACEIVGLWPILAHLPAGLDARPRDLHGGLSRGEIQRIGLARALVRHPEALVLDEGIDALDDEEAMEILRRVRRERPRCAIVHCTHRSALAAAADRVALLDPGRGGARAGRLGRVMGVLALAAAVGIASPSCVTVSRVDERRFEMAPSGPRAIIGEPPAPEERPRDQPALFAPARWIDKDDARLGEAAIEGVNALARAIESASLVQPETDTETLPEALPRDAGIVVPMPDVSEAEAGDVLRSAALWFTTAHSYLPASAERSAFLPPAPPSGLEALTLVRTQDGHERYLRFAAVKYATRPMELQVLGVERVDGALRANPDLAQAEGYVRDMASGRGPGQAMVALSGMASEVFQLSFVDPKTALAALQGFGVSTQAEAGALSATLAADFLPMVTAMPSPPEGATSLVGASAAGPQDMVRTSQGLTVIPNVAGPLNQETVSGPVGRLLIHYAPAAPEQLARVLGLLREHIDVPARQVLIEGMVLEISEDGLRDLGIEWEFQDGAVRAMLGAAVAGVDLDTVQILAQKSADFASDWAVRIRALIREGKAEILSRPSVLTLDNRQATIRVGEDIPVATSQEGTSGTSNKIAFDFRYIPTGILLNVRPRIDAADEQISLQIDTTVSAVVPGADLEIRDAEGALLASAPTIASRRVQTYARIANNTPFIIGGLVSRNDSTVIDKVPILGDLPLIGAAFRAERTQTLKREVIIVLTPYVLTDATRASRVKPKASDAFHDVGHVLFRDSYRLAEGDVFDLGFLRRDARLARARERVREAAARDPGISSDPLLSPFAGSGVPGENILVVRMLYDVVKRLELPAAINPSRCIVLSPDGEDAFRVEFLEAIMGRSLVVDEAGGVVAGETALAITFREATNGEWSSSPGLAAAAPEISVVPCSDRDEWAATLRRLNEQEREGERRATILIQNAEDMERLRSAMALKRCITLNGGWRDLSLAKFQVGSLLMLPEIGAQEVSVIDAETAYLFYLSEHYYSAVNAAIDASLRAVEERLGQDEGAR